MKLVAPRANGKGRVSTVRPSTARALWLLIYIYVHICIYICWYRKGCSGTGGQDTSLLTQGSPTGSWAGGPASSQLEAGIPQPAHVTFKQVGEEQPAGSKVPWCHGPKQDLWQRAASLGVMMSQKPEVNPQCHCPEGSVCWPVGRGARGPIHFRQASGKDLLECGP